MMTCSPTNMHINIPTHTHGKPFKAKQKGSQSLNRVRKICVHKVLPAHSARGKFHNVTRFAFTSSLSPFSAYIRMRCCCA